MCFYTDASAGMEKKEQKPGFSSPSPDWLAGAVFDFITSLDVHPRRN
jgi:hypothetical protein